VNRSLVMNAGPTTVGVLIETVTGLSLSLKQESVSDERTL
jgi:hypothetical protein